MIVLAGAKAMAVWAAAGLSSLAVAVGLFLCEPAASPAALETVRLSMADGTLLDVGRYEITWNQWKACYDAGACTYLPRRGKSASGEDYPVASVNRFDIEEFLVWINRGSDRVWRLPTAGEWSAIASQLPQRPYRKLFTDPRLAWAADYGAMARVSKTLRPTGSYGRLTNGIYDLAGNVWEWTSTCAANDAGIADSEHCPALLVEGEHEAVLSVFLRDPSVGGCAAGVPPANVGFRLVAEVRPA